ncbi:MAG: hypothetical protein U0Q22_11415 [Acidimicrobiales bacterium]
MIVTAVAIRSHSVPERSMRTLGTAALIACALTSASASSVGGVTARSLDGFTMSADPGAPTVIAWDAFDGTNGTNLNGATTDGGSKTWVKFGGNWSIQGNKAKSNAASPSGLILNAGVSSGSSEATITASGTYDAEMITNSNSTGTDHLLLSWNSAAGGSLEIWKYQGSSYTVRASITGIGAPTNAKVRLESTSGSVLNGYVDGVLRVTYTLTAGEQTTYKNGTHTYFGIVAYNDSASTFDNYHVDA